MEGTYYPSIRIRSIWKRAIENTHSPRGRFPYYSSACLGNGNESMFQSEIHMLGETSLPSVIRCYRGATSSQLSAKPSISDICLIRILLNMTQEIRCVTFHLNEASPNISGVLNMRRNAHSLADMASRNDSMMVDYL